MTGFSFSLELLTRLRERYGQVAAGIKDSSGDWENMKLLAREIPDFSVYAGTEKFLLDILCEGGAGCITATGNLTSPACSEVYRAWRSGDSDEADRAQQLLTRQRLALQQKPFVSGLKALLEQSTNDPSWKNLLPPFVPLTPEDASAFSKEATAAGIQLPSGN